MANNEKFEQLVELIYDTTDTMPMQEARRVAARIVAAGWQWHPPTLSADEEVDLVDRIISGLPPRAVSPKVKLDLPEEYTKPANPEGPAVYKRQKLDIPEGLIDVASLHPVELNTWTRIPTWDNYEINLLGDVRSRWTKRTLEDETDITDEGERYVQMHDKDGFSHLCHVKYLMEQTFGAPNV